MKNINKMLDKRICGVYIIKCTTNDRYYVGSSVNIKSRWYVHLNELKKNIHHSSKLQRAFNKYGKESFVFEILEECEPIKEIILKREQFYIDSMSPFFNICKTAGSFLGKKCKESTKLKLSISNTGKKRSKETCENIGKAKKGIPLTNEHKEKLRKANLGKVQSKEAINKQKETVRIKKENEIKLLSDDEIIKIEEEKKEKIRLQNKIRREINIDRYNEISRKTRLKNKEKIKIANKKYREKVKEDKNNGIERIINVNHAMYDKCGELCHNSKKYIIITPLNDIEVIMGMTEYCRINNLTRECMKRVLNGTYKKHKGYRCYHFSDYLYNKLILEIEFKKAA